jgi:hypothetical protein
MASVKDRIAEMRIERMRLGQAVCDVVPLASNPEIRVCIVPLLESEYLQVLEEIAQISMPDNLATLQLKDRRQAAGILVRSIREPEDLSARVYNDVEELTESLDVADIDEISDRYNEMIEKSSPSLDGLSAMERDALKKELLEADWSVLSGRAWYAAKRFLSLISQELPQVKLPG